MLVLFHTHAFMFCWLTTEAASLPPGATFDHREPTTFPVHPFMSTRVDCWGRSRQVSLALSCRNPCSGELEWFWPWRGGASPLIWCGSGLEETLFTFAQRCMVCSWESRIWLTAWPLTTFPVSFMRLSHCTALVWRAAGIRLAEASIQYLGFVMFSGSRPTCLPVDALYDAWRFVNGIIVLAGRVQMVVLGRPVRPGHTLQEFVSNDNALTIIVCSTPLAVSPH